MPRPCEGGGKKLLIGNPAFSVREPGPVPADRLVMVMAGDRSEG